MVKVKFMDGTPVPDDYLTSASLLVRDAALAIDMFGEDELEAATRGTSQDAREAAMEQKRCCVCGGEIFDEDESAFGACADCLDNAQRDPEAFIEKTATIDIDALHAAMAAADKRFQVELERVYGARAAGDARYLWRHEDAAVDAAASEYVAAQVAWIKAVRGNERSGAGAPAAHEES